MTEATTTALAVADAGSFGAAARSLGVSQPTVSRRIRDLEGSVELILFERSATGVRPTKAGRAFLARARAAQYLLATGLVEARGE